MTTKCDSLSGIALQNTFSNQVIACETVAYGPSKKATLTVNHQALPVPKNHAPWHGNDTVMTSLAQ